MSRGPDPSLPSPSVRSRRSRRVRRSRMRRTRRLVVSLAVLGTLAAGGVMLVRSPLFAVDGIEVIGERLLSEDEVLAASGLRLGMNVLSVDGASVQRRLTDLALIKSARVERLYPSRVRIRVTERQASVAARTPDGLWLVEASGGLIAPVAAAPDGVPEVRIGAKSGSPAMREAMRLWVALPEWAREKTSDIEASEPSLITARIGGTRIVFGSADDVIPKMQAVIAIFERAKADGRRVARIDVRSPRRPAAVFA